MLDKRHIFLNCANIALSGKWVTGGSDLSRSEHFPPAFCIAVASVVMAASSPGAPPAAVDRHLGIERWFKRKADGTATAKTATPASASTSTTTPIWSLKLGCGRSKHAAIDLDSGSEQD